MDERWQRRRNEIALAKVSLAIVFVCILCHSVKWVPNVYELWRATKAKRDWPPWIESMTYISHFCITLNSRQCFQTCFFALLIPLPPGSPSLMGLLFFSVSDGLLAQKRTPLLHLQTDLGSIQPNLSRIYTAQGIDVSRKHFTFA